MHLILGGRYMGKRAWAESLYGVLTPVCDLKNIAPEDFADFEARLRGAKFILNLQAGVRALLLKNMDNPVDFFMAQDFRDCVLIGDEVGSGVVPMEPFERRWRDETGLLYQALAERADIVDRVWAGLPCRLKGKPIGKMKGEG